MIHLFIELGSYRQIMRLRPTVVEGIVENLKGLVEYSGGACELCENGTLLFSADPHGGGKERAVELIHDTYSVLLENRRELQGFVLIADQLVDSADGTAYPVLGELRRSAMGVDREESLWLGRRLWEFLGDEFIGEEAGDLVRIVERVVAGPQSARDSAGFFVRPSIVGEMREAIEAQQHDAEGWVRIIASDTSGGRANLHSCLAELGRGKSSVDWVTLGAGRDSLSPLEPFLESIRPSFLTVVPEYLSKSDRMLWEQRVGVLDFSCTDYPREDFFSIYSLYLLAYARYMKRRRLPPVVLCYGADRYPEASVHFLVRLLSRFSGYGRLIPVCVTAGGEPLGELENLPHRRVVVGPLDNEEIVAGIEGCPQLQATDVERLARRTGGEALFLYHLCLLDRPSDAKGIQISLQLLRSRDSACRRILYVTYLAEGLLSQSQVASFLINSGLAEEVYKRERLNLIRFGFLDEESGRLAVPELGHLLAGEQDDEELDAQIAQYCYELWREGELSVTRPAPANPQRIDRLFWFLSRNGKFNQALLVFTELMNRLLDQRMVDEALRHLEQENLFRMSLSPEETKTRDFFTELTAFRAAILLGAREQADLRFVRLKEMQVAGEWERGLLDLQSAQHHYAAFEPRLALDVAKRALISAQSIESGALEARADIEIGLTMLAGCRFEEAEEYFFLCRSAAQPESARFEHIRSLTFEAITLYLYGNISKALKLAEEAGASAASSGRREWQRLTLFLRGRCYFTLGMYEEALKVFQAGGSFCRIYPHDQAAKVFAAWAARSVVFGASGDPRKLFEALDRDAEVLLFLAEWSVEAGGTDRAVELTAESLELQRQPREEYVPGEVVPWASGFSAIEDRALRNAEGHGVLYYRARAMSHYLNGLAGNADEATAEFTRLTREDRLSDHDPNNYYYYHLHSRIVPHGEGELLVDRLTVLSKAIKHLQERATRIDDVKKRQSFLHRSLWNARLIDDAKRLKLM